MSEVTKEAPELIYEFQPTDEQGRPLGGKQVFKYKTNDELLEKLKQQNVHLVRKLREQTRKQRLGIVDELEPPAEPAAKLDENDITPMRLMATIEADAFVRDTPEYFKCQENFEAITQWMLKRGLDPIRQNFKLAYDHLKKHNLLIEKPADPVPETPVVEVPKPVQPRQETPRVPSGFTRREATDQGGSIRSVGDEIIYDHPVKDGNGKVIKTIRYTGAKAVDMMPADEFKRRIKDDKTFNSKYERLLKEQDNRRSTTN